MRFIILTDANDKPLVVNLDHVMCFMHSMNGTMVYGADVKHGPFATVKESTHTIAAWIKEWTKEVNAT